MLGRCRCVFRNRKHGQDNAVGSLEYLEKKLVCTRSQIWKGRRYKQFLARLRREGKREKFRRIQEEEIQAPL